MPTRRHPRAQAKTAYILRERRLNAIQRELDRAAAARAAAQRQAQCDALRATNPKAAQWADRDDAIDHLLQTLTGPPDYGNDPPPF